MGVRPIVPPGPRSHTPDLRPLEQTRRRLLDGPAAGLRELLGLRWLRDLFPRALPDAAPEHGHRLLLQRRPLPDGTRSPDPGEADAPLRRHGLRGPLATRRHLRRDDLPGRCAHGPLRPERLLKKWPR